MAARCPAARPAAYRPARDCIPLIAQAHVLLRLKRRCAGARGAGGVRGASRAPRGAPIRRKRTISVQAHFGLAYADAGLHPPGFRLERTAGLFPVLSRLRKKRRRRYSPTPRHTTHHDSTTQKTNPWAVDPFLDECHATVQVPAHLLCPTPFPPGLLPGKEVVPTSSS